MRLAATATLLATLLAISPSLSRAQAGNDDAGCSSLPFTACLLNLGCIYDAIEGSCKAYTTTTTMPEQPVTASAADMDPAEGYEFSYEDFMSSNIDASPPMVDIED